ncbi:MAG: hypothetical protein K0Q79_3754 [Flavipsychrobacter sp.]|jgi:hypothetical protein|nr:hypothetical protein [Flavipsychrobacter sp.]
MATQKEKVIKSLKKGVKEMKLIEARELQAQDFGEMMQELKASRDKHGGAGRGQGRKPAGYTTRIWVTDQEKKMITDKRKAEKKVKQR